MLLFSREGSGEHGLTEVNAVVEESLNLAYHGARAENPHFDVASRCAATSTPAPGPSICTRMK